MNFIQIDFVLNILKALILTILIELLALIMQKEKKLIIYLTLIIVNIITNISLNLIIQMIPSSHFDIIVLGLEIMIVLIEASCYYILIKNFNKALRISLICNLFSYLIGLLLIPFIY